MEGRGEGDGGAKLKRKRKKMHEWSQVHLCVCMGIYGMKLNKIINGERMRKTLSPPHPFGGAVEL